MVFQQGDIIAVSFDPSLGHEPQKRRPGVVVSSDDFNMKSSMTFVAPITTTKSNYPLHVVITEETDDIYGSVCVEQTRAMDLAARPSERVGRLCESDMAEVLTCLGAIFDL